MCTPSKGAPAGPPEEKISLKTLELVWYISPCTSHRAAGGSVLPTADQTGSPVAAHRLPLTLPLEPSASLTQATDNHSLPGEGRWVGSTRCKGNRRWRAPALPHRAAEQTHFPDRRSTSSPAAETTVPACAPPGDACELVGLAVCSIQLWILWLSPWGLPRGSATVGRTPTGVPPAGSSALPHRAAGGPVRPTAGHTGSPGGTTVSRRRSP